MRHILTLCFALIASVHWFAACEVPTPREQPTADANATDSPATKDTAIADIATRDTTTNTTPDATKDNGANTTKDEITDTQNTPGDTTPDKGTTTLPPLRDGMKVEVRTIIDGDTVYVYPANKGRWPYYKIRMWGYNSPECYKGKNKYGYGCTKDKEGYGLASYETFVTLLNKRGLVLTVSCPIKGQTGQLCKTDPYERYLAFLLLPDGTNIALKMLAAGAGWVYTIFYPPLLKELCQAEADAIRNKAGMWKAGRDAVKQSMSSNTRSWYYHRTSSKTHDAICSKALGKDFNTVAGE